MEGPRGAAGGRSRRPACLVRYQQVTQCQPSLGCGRTSPSRRGVVSPLFPLSFPWGDGLLFVQARVKIGSDAATVSDLVPLFFLEESGVPGIGGRVRNPRVWRGLSKPLSGLEIKACPHFRFALRSSTVSLSYGTFKERAKFPSCSQIGSGETHTLTEWQKWKTIYTCSEINDLELWEPPEPPTSPTS